MASAEGSRVRNSSRQVVSIGPPAVLYAHYKLDQQSIAEVARELLGRS